MLKQSHFFTDSDTARRTTQEDNKIKGRRRAQRRLRARRGRGRRSQRGKGKKSTKRKKQEGTN